MSPRTKTLRKVLSPPIIKGFNPYGSEAGKPPAEPVLLMLEEYEALRLCDYDGFNQLQASVMMGVSRPTFTRIYAAALQKIARAFVEGRRLSIKGGKVYFDSDWFYCHSCKCYFNNPDKDKKLEQCPLCGKSDFVPFDSEPAGEGTGKRRCDSVNKNTGDQSLSLSVNENCDNINR